jgi:hypothetical protein
LTHFSPSRPATPSASSLVSAGKLGFSKCPNLLGQHVPGHLRVGDDHPGHRAEPEKARLLPVLPHVPAEERRDAGRDVVAPQRQGPRPRLPVHPGVLPEVVRQEAVRRGSSRRGCHHSRCSKRTACLRSVRPRIP